MTTHMSADEYRHAVAKGHGHQPESVILQQVRDVLRLWGWVVVRMQQGLGSHKGIGDLLCFRAGKTHWVEIKTPSGRLSEHQLRFQQEMEDQKIPYSVVHSIEEVESMRELET